MYELKNNGKVVTSKFVGTGPSSYKKRIYRAAVLQRLRNTVLDQRFPTYMSMRASFFNFKIKFADFHLPRIINARNDRRQNC